MNKLNKLIKTHWAIFGLALVVGCLIVLPQLFYIFTVDDFQGILNISFHDDEQHYLARVQDIIDGHPTLGNAYIYEHKDKPPMQFFLSEWLLAQPLKLFNVSAPIGFVFYDFIFPFVIVLLTYWCAFLLTRSRSAAFTTCAFLTVLVYLHILGRPVSPQFILTFWISQLILLVLLLRSTRLRKLFVGLCAVNFGLLFYVYPYYWTFYGSLLALFIVLLYVYKFPDLGKKVLMILGAGIVLGIPYFMYALQASQFAEFQEIMVRQGLIYSHFPSGIKIIIPCASLLALYVFFIKRKLLRVSPVSLLMIAGLTAALITVNQHVLTGRNIQFASHYAMGAIFWSVFSLAFLLKEVPLKEVMNRALNMAITAAVLFLVSGTLFVFIRMNFLDIKEMVETFPGSDLQRYAPALDWLNKNTEKDEVVYVNQLLSYFVTVYTRNNVLHSPYVNFYLMSDEEIAERFTLTNFFENINENFVKKNFTAIYGDGYESEYQHAVQENKVRKVLGFKEREVEEYPEIVISNYLNTAARVKEAGFREGLKKYRVSYIMWDKNQNPNWRLGDYGIDEALFSDNNIYIYSL